MVHMIWARILIYFQASLEAEEPAAEDDADLLEHIMVMADCVDQSIQTLRGQLNLIIFNLRTEPASRDKYEKVLEMMKNLQYLRITVNRSVRSQSHKSECNRQKRQPLINHRYNRPYHMVHIIWTIYHIRGSLMAHK